MENSPRRKQHNPLIAYKRQVNHKDTNLITELLSVIPAFKIQIPVQVEVVS